ncbi:M23 family metallopeptidase [Pseudodesulfovibrio indicus]|uniref:Murein DD-endopeptidase MepM/ murein hydrolase activator NlpD n=1 Tax=Pseudodesulfovibrio indicus TaxID=1716143 RepID=A0A126QRG2_9BACT|nr:M23 family metallopeptidase [Pseudodesulfovibrio indicus]AMK12653.1 peptidase M23 [Pseudodesulfovibrio indicus]TDT90967.1 murein DD-endopeptidase MepM/ murein hydrolase activator NlpD [Pseudodesulfovibrio indicus]
MRRFVLMLVMAVCLMLAPAPAPAQSFGLEEGDDAGVVLPKDAEAGTPAPAPAQSVPALVLAAPSKVGVGRPFLVRLTSDLPLESVSIHWQGREVVPSISVWNNRHVALAMLGTDVLSERPGKEDLSVIASVDGKESTLRRTVRVTSVDYPTQELTLPEKMVTPPQDVLDRIAAEGVKTSEAKNTVSAQRLWTLPLERPVDGIVLSVYGARRILNGKPKNPHRGLDFRSPMGNPVKSVAAGKVILVGDHYYAGNSVYVDHGNGVVSMYFHLSEPTVKEGDAVERGQTVGLTGMTGRATGPHLHFSLSVLGELVDPAGLFQAKADDMLQ